MSAPNLFVLDPKLVCIIETPTKSPLPGWQKLAAFRRGQNGHENFRQARICYFRDKCVVFARNCKFANSILMICNIYNEIVHLFPNKHCV